MMAETGWQALHASFSEMPKNPSITTDSTIASKILFSSSQAVSSFTQGKLRGQKHWAGNYISLTAVNALLIGVLSLTMNQTIFLSLKGRITHHTRRSSLPLSNRTKLFCPELTHKIKRDKFFRYSIPFGLKIRMKYALVATSPEGSMRIKLGQQQRPWNVLAHWQVKRFTLGFKRGGQS